MENEPFDYREHWPGKWPKREFAEETNRIILKRIAEQEQSLLFTLIQRLRQKLSHKPIDGAIIGTSQFELTVNYLVVMRAHYLRHHGWPNQHDDLIESIIQQCAPSVITIKPKEKPPI